MTHRCRRPTGHVNVMGDVWIERCTSDDPHDECRYDGGTQIAGPRGRVEKSDPLPVPSPASELRDDA